MAGDGIDQIVYFKWFGQNGTGPGQIGDDTSLMICSQAHLCLSCWKKETPTDLNDLSLYYRQLLAAQ